MSSGTSYKAPNIWVAFYVSQLPKFNIEMHLFITLFILAVLSLGGSAALCGSPCDLYTITWEEEFDSTTVNTSVWNFRTDQKALSAQLAANVEQSNDNLVINLKKQQVNTYS